MSIHYGVCVGPVDEVVAVSISEKDVGVSGVTSNTVIDFDDMSLFGGTSKGGGIRGQLHIMFGGATQTLATFLAEKLGRTPSTVSGYRNLLSVFFTGPAGTADGFTWSSNIPQVPTVEFTVRRAPKGLAGDAMIGPDANPAHLIYEALIDTDWGAGYLVENIDVDSFLYAAQVFRDESFGVSFLWSGATKVEEFINEVLQHISANLVFDLAFAKWTILPLRGDYELTALREINPSNADLVSFQRKGWGETINEVVVTWTNPEGEGEETVTQQDASGFAIQKTAVSDSSRNYLGIRSQEVAWRVAERDLRQSGNPLAAVELDVSLSERGLTPGSVLWLNWNEVDEDGDVFLEPIVVRVLKVKEPKRGAASFRISVLEDVFSYGVSRTQVQASEFVSPDQDPIDPPNVLLADSPYFIVAQERGDAEAEAIESPEGHVTVLANTGLTDIREIELFGERPVPESTPEFISLNTLDDVGFFLTDVPLGREVYTTLSLPSGHVRKSLRVGGFLILEDSTRQEVCVVRGITETSLLLRRGCLDTVPLSWTFGTRAWEVQRQSQVYDPTVVFDGETVTYKLAPITSRGQLQLSDASERDFVVGDRMLRPTRPAKVALDGQGAGASFSFTLASTEIATTVSWARRNRITETSTVLEWDADSTPAEVGQTTSVSLSRGATVLASAAGLTGGSVDLDLSGATLVVGETLDLSVWSVRDGFTSWTKAEIPVIIT
jgi:hypothetical protein